MKQGILTTRRWLRRLVDSFYSKNWKEMGSFGSDSVWNIYTANLGQNSIIYSAGVGKDISFEIQLIHDFHCQVYLFDPSPTGIQTIALPVNHVPGLVFNPVGLAGQDGPQVFSLPRNPEEGSYSISGENDATTDFECKRISTLMAENGHLYIDLLKLDIEGFEYPVIFEISQKKIPVNQICVEFHDFFDSIEKSDTRRAMQALKNAGYRLIYKDGCNFTYLQEKVLQEKKRAS